MKTKKLDKKLSLNKNTVSHLNTLEMLKNRGGKVDIYPAVQKTHDSCDVYVCTEYTEGPPPYGCTWTDIIVNSFCVVCYTDKTTC